MDTMPRRYVRVFWVSFNSFGFDVSFSTENAVGSGARGSISTTYRRQGWAGYSASYPLSASDDDEKRQFVSTRPRAMLYIAQ